MVLEESYVEGKHNAFNSFCICNLLTVFLACFKVSLKIINNFIVTTIQTIRIKLYQNPHTNTCTIWRHHLHNAISGITELQIQQKHHITLRVDGAKKEGTAYCAPGIIYVVHWLNILTDPIYQHTHRSMA